ncbi:AI-2E family transporter [Hymenobacter jejuensis]|uniref:AI-2E family transporter n=1 Tax=Hymenobacter jejuensis TaxID=2502781 RepID=A0A5B8A2F1_9BACT|nr:AI-2E family transporter [Hymenobacter jejuensis]QDA61468.1 AI-2E family transporter [Hymenobacter jejuensis]
MNEAPKVDLPFYVKAPLVLLGLALLVFTLHIAGEILFPIFFAAIFAILLLPIEQWLRRHRVPELLAIGLTVLVGVVALAGLLYFIYLQAAQLASQLPLFKVKLLQAQQELVRWLDAHFGITNERLLGWLREGTSRGTALLGQTLTTVSGLLVVATLVPVYVFLLLLYRERLVTFLIQVFSGRRHDTGVEEVLHESKSTIQSYMVGLLIEGGIVAVLNVIGLLLLGIPYALLLGVLGALLNFIPYIGGLIAILLPVLMAFVAKDSYGYAIGVVVVYMVIQFIDNHILIPRIVAGKVQVNALAAIVGVLVGNAIGGVPGMFLALPGIAILKIVFDRIEPMKPWATLLGDEERPRPGKSARSR